MPNNSKVMKTSKWITGLTIVLCYIFLAQGGRTEPLRIFAAASLQGPLDVISEDWNIDTIINYAGSGTLARQIDYGASADLVILANAYWMDWLIERGQFAGTATDIISNQLVVIGPHGTAPMSNPTKTDLLDRLSGGRLAMGQRASVPAGIYAQAWLENIGAWGTIQNHLAETDNVRAALVLVARGEVPLGIVYSSDAASEEAVSILWRVPSDQHSLIRYPAIALTPTGEDFLAYIETRTDVLISSGFKALQ
jgi:molybdate transport system substrate-binding protein